MDAAILAYTIFNIQKCTSSLKSPAARLEKEITELETHLKEIHANVKKAEQSSDMVLPWLRKVKEVVMDLSDLADDLRLLLKERTSAKRNTGYRSQVTKAINDLKRLNDEAQTQHLSFTQQPLSHHEPDETVAAVPVVVAAVPVVGRENEKKEIIDQLLILSPAPVLVPVVAIVGVVGIGKSTLARLVCEAEQVKAHFAKPIWVPGNTFNMDSITELVTADSAPTDGKRCLLVVDDLRIAITGEDLEKLQQKLAEAGGAAVLITTRSNLVVRSCNNKVKTYPLQELNAKDSLLLFKQFHGRDLNNAESEIIKKCFGVPQAIVVMVRLLNRRDSSLSESELPAFRKEFLQKLKSTYYDNLPVVQKLFFAYCSLFPQDYFIYAERLIQLWFAEGFLLNDFNVSPKGLAESGRKSFNDFAPFVFQQVEAAGEGDEGYGLVSRTYYRINPLMHEVARFVAREENVIVDSEGKKLHDGGVLRVSFDFALSVSIEIPDSVFEKAKKLRSILLPAVTNKSQLPHEVKITTSTCDKIFETFKATLRVLDLHDLEIKTVPSSIGEIKYLRYLDLSHSNIEKLPNSITKLSHLQTLKLSRCHVLKELPKDLGDLSCLMHLDIQGCLDLTHMPPGIKKLTRLQTLSLFVSSKKYVMGGLQELTELEHLGGHLEISHLEQLNFSKYKKEEFVKNKQQLECLTLRWDHDGEKEERVNNRLYRGGSARGGDAMANDKDKNSLECLEPHPNLRELLIVGYNGRTFSEWLSSVQGLVKLSMNDCPKCQFLPPMDQLPHLKVLQLRRMDSLEFIAKNDSINDRVELFFPSLKELTISDCPQLRSWWENEKNEKDRPSFPCISKLHIQCCLLLACMPLYPYLDQELVVVDSCVKSVRDTRTAEISDPTFSPFSKLKSMHIAQFNQSPPEGWFKNFTSLEKLHIRDCTGLESVPKDFKSLVSLQSLTIERCLKLDLNKDTTEWLGLEKLRSLTVRGIPSLQSLPWGVEDVYSLQQLGLYECPNLTYLPETIGDLVSLTKLVISDCKKLDSLPKGMENLKSLKTLIITGCPLLLPRCQPETGDDWPQIAHIEQIIVKQTSHDSMDL